MGTKYLLSDEEIMNDLEDSEVSEMGEEEILGRKILDEGYDDSEPESGPEEER